MTRERFLFIDLLRIIGISLILCEHVITSNLYPFLLKYHLEISLYGGMVYITYGRIGVAIFLLASGCSLAYSNSEIRALGDIKNFYSKRLSRIYPAYWAAIIFSIMMEPWILQRSFSSIEIFKYIIGFQAWGAKTGLEALGKINGPFWFLTPLLSLYLMYPLILYLITKRPNLSILSFFVISFVSTYLMLRYYTSEPAWSPLYWLFVFGLGIYLIKMNWYPRIGSKIKAIIFLSNIVFYIYLISEPLDFTILQYPVLFSVSLFMIATMFYAFDKQIRELLAKVSRSRSE